MMRTLVILFGSLAAAGWSDAWDVASGGGGRVDNLARTPEPVLIDGAGTTVYWRTPSMIEVIGPGGGSRRIESAAMSLRVVAHDVTIVIATPSLDGAGVGEPAISADARADRLTVLGEGRKRPTISGYAGGILAADSEGVRVDSLVFTNLAGSGVVVGPAAVITGVTVSACRGPGIRASHGSSATDIDVSACLGDGLVLGHRGRASLVRSGGNAGVGIGVGPGGAITDSRAHNNAGHGVTLGRGAIARSVVAVSNIGSGVVGSYSSLVDRSVAELNGADGVRVDDGSLVEATVANDNADAGVRLSAGCVVRGAAARSNVRTGIVVGPGGKLVDVVVSNGFEGVRVVGSGVTLESVTAHGNAYGVLTIEGGDYADGLRRVSFSENRVADEHVITSEDLETWP